MKNIVIFTFLIFLLNNCNAQKANSEIVYFLPNNVEKEITKKIDSINDKSSIFFTLGNDQLGNFVIYLNTKMEKEYNFWLLNTNRCLYLNNKYYPIVLKSDEFFSYPESRSSVTKKIEKGEPLKKVITIRDNTFRIKFNLNGKIIE